MTRRIAILAGAVLVGVMLGCSSENSVVPESGADVVFITDRDGKRWNIEHAAQTYGLEAHRFQRGIGADVIRPVNDPVILSAGDDDYPRSDENFFIIGTHVDGEARAYSIQSLRRPEVVNENIGDPPIVVAY